MKQSSFKFRWINSQCYEFILPNGKHVITDPYITPKPVPGFRVFSVEEIEQCDYILLTHSHYDHTSDIGYLCEKFNARLIAGEMTIMPVAKAYDLNLGALIPMSNMQRLELPDFDLLPVRGKHYDNKVLHYKDVMERGALKNGDAACNAIGTVETYDFCITLKNNLRIMFVSGLDYLNNIYTVAEAFRPNVLFRHTAGSGTAEHWANVINRYHVQYAFPNHQENLYNGKWGKDMDTFTKEIQQGLAALGSDTQFINPEPFAWYEISMGLDKI